MTELKVGDRISLQGGYDHEPAWLGGKERLLGAIVEFIPGQNSEPAAIVKLDLSHSVEGVEGDYAVLELRYAGATWLDNGVVHVEFCDFLPEPKAWAQRRQGKWVESHASYSAMSGADAVLSATVSSG